MFFFLGPPEEPYPLLPPEPDDEPERVYPYSELPEVPRLLVPELGGQRGAGL